MKKTKNKIINVGALARVEGEGGLTLEFKGKAVVDVKFNIFEPPRFFEAFLRGRSYAEAPDITARICGICPIAYQMSAVHAIERAFGIAVDEPLRALRRLIYCGERIESHSLHVFMLHAPDFLGYADAIKMAQDHPDRVRLGLEVKKVGNELVSLLGGREVHPINVRVGGFYRVPMKSELAPLAEKLKWALDMAVETVHWVATFPFPEFEQDYEFIALRHAHEYPFNEGRLVSNRGLDIAANEYDSFFKEEHVEHSTALHSARNKAGGYLVGPLARYNLNFDRFSPLVQEAARSAGLGPVCRNPFQSIIVRGVEILHGCEEALRLIENYQMPEKPSMKIQPRVATGYAITEAPRGILYHRYSFDNEGLILDAKIVPPTSQNQRTIENDLYHLATQHVDFPKEVLTRLCEQAIRNYDPCISCSTHLIDL